MGLSRLQRRAGSARTPGGGRAPGGAPGGGGSSFTRWGVDAVYMSAAPPPPPPEPRAAGAGGDGGALPPASERMHVLLGHGAEAAGAIAVGGASLAKEAAKAVQGAAGISAEQVELLGLGLGLCTGLVCLCGLRALWRYYSHPAREHSRGARARRMLAGSFQGRRGRGGRAQHAAVPVDDFYDDDDDDDEYGY